MRRAGGTLGRWLILGLLALPASGRGAESLVPPSMRQTPPVADPSPAAMLDLAAFVERAEQHDPKLAAAFAGEDAGRAQTGRARSGFLPRVEASGSRVRQRTRLADQALPERVEREWKLTLTQPLFDWDTWSNVRLAEAAQIRAAMQTGQARQAVRLKAVQTYFAALQARDELWLAQGQQQTVQQQHEVTRMRRMGGEASLIDLRDVEVEVERSGNAVARAQSTFRLRMRELEDMIGQTIGEIAGLPAAQPVPEVYPHEVRRWLEQTEASNPDIALARLEHRIAGLESSRAMGDYLPQASLTASTGKQSSSVQLSGRAVDVNSVGISVRIPLFSGLDSMYRQRQNRANEDKALADLDAVRRDVLALVQESHLLARARRDEIGDLERQAAAIQVALAATRVGRQVGDRTEVNVLAYQNALWAARRDLLRARYEVLTHGVRLKALTGSLEMSDVQVINAMLSREEGLRPPQTEALAPLQ